MDYQVKKIGITGANGFVGQNTFKYFASLGYLVKGFTSSTLIPNLTYLDLNDLTQMESELADIDVLIHSAWVGSDRVNRDKSDVQVKNISIAKNLIKISRNTNISRIVGIGSQDELLDGEQPWKDESKMFAMTEYAKAKVESFNIFATSAINFTWARLFSVYGKSDKRDWIMTRAVKCLREDIPATFGKCSKPWSLTHIEDAAIAIELLVKKETNGIVNISNLDSPSLKSHMQLLQSISRKNLFTFSPNPTPERELSRTLGVIDKVGWKPILSREERFLELLS
jgi:nucleoside-diphosphate-sugar epimerase